MIPTIPPRPKFAPTFDQLRDLWRRVRGGFPFPFHSVTGHASPPAFRDGLRLPEPSLSQTDSEFLRAAVNYTINMMQAHDLAETVPPDDRRHRWLAAIIRIIVTDLNSGKPAAEVERALLVPVAIFDYPQKVAEVAVGENARHRWPLDLFTAEAVAKFLSGLSEEERESMMAELKVAESSAFLIAAGIAEEEGEP